ncbi:GNAT family N-acetyltransferase [Actinophytocola gossypii]|uniref:GNAT family N-acetyltransferase n=1 Tax=Actinophytocola gossypii TaxID=2812003 RepID=A0ABT2J291_9PSEU|nr:GNAT family N-acetyltransferase [Actinophytocola gossypii]MCT2581719.1 GNAT family N-acetyltransferase [Actinophytocola gossypii]
MLDELMRRGWPALEEVSMDGWLARFSGGVTQRANSVLPLTPPSDVDAALSRVASTYRARGLPAVFQLGPTVYPPDLDALLAARGYAYGSPTLVMTASAAEVLDRLPAGAARVTVADEPDEEWMDLWWRVDGRGDERARSVARRILTAGPARYATAWDGAGAAAVARLALVDGWGGLYCVAVRPDARRRGLAAATTQALVGDGGARDCWLQVRAENEPALTLYRGAGFTEVARYHYRTRRLPEGSR